ncbi:MAG: cation transporter [Thermaerobacter sp.]|nr:cation transporter [Thermaerobacter sp.]
MAALTLAIDGMTCDHCKMTVTKALMGVEGVKTAQVSLEDARADVEFDPARVSVEALVQAVDEEGYGAHAL